MSASSLWVTWGTFSHERCRNGPDSFLIRGSGTVSTGPNLEKSWAGTSGMPAPAGAAAGAARSGPRTAASRSSLTIRPFSPLPLMVLRSRSSSRASRRTLGLAWAPVTSVIAAGAAGAAGGRLGLRLLLADQAGRSGERAGAVAADDHHHGALADRVADLDPDVLDLAGGGGRDVHGRLVGLQGDEGVLLGDHVARGHVHLDHRDVLVVTDVGDRDLCGCHCSLRSTQVWEVWVSCGPGWASRGRCRTWRSPWRPSPPARRPPGPGPTARRGRRSTGRPRRTGAACGGSRSGRTRRSPAPCRCRARTGGSGRRRP